MALRRKIQQGKAYSILIFVFLISLLANIQSHPFWRLDNIWLDTIIRATADNNPPDPSIVIIDIDDNTIDNMSGLAGRWPWPRSIHGELLEQLLKQSPKAVVFDILFSEPDLFRPDGDQYLSEVVGSSNNIFLSILHIKTDRDHQYPAINSHPFSLGAVNASQSSAIPHANLLLPRAIDSNAWQLGTINFAPEKDGKGRTYEIRHWIENWYIPSLPNRVATAITGKELDKDRIILEWRKGNKRPYPTHSYSEVYFDLSKTQTSLDTPNFKEKIIIIGSTAAGLNDIQSTPIHSVYPSVYILATAIDNLINHSWLENWNIAYEAVISLLFFGLCLLGLRYIGNVIHLFLLLLILSGCLASISYFLVTTKLLFPMVGNLILIWVFAIMLFGLRYLQGQKELAQAVELFGRFLDPNVVKNLVDQGITQELTSGRTAHVTILFSDIRNFTTLSEQSTAAEVVELLNRYFSQQVKVIFKHNGTLDKFIGDAIMAFWGEPVKSDRHEIDAVEAALDMAEAMEVFKNLYGASDFDIGIGVHTGEVVAGAIGSEARYDYTVIGDAVNLASRIEGLTKGKCRILVSDATRAGCGETFDFKVIGDYMVKGRKEPVTVYQPRRKVR